jgi:hypothetical protein
MARRIASGNEPGDIGFELRIKGHTLPHLSPTLLLLLRRVGSDAPWCYLLYAYSPVGAIAHLFGLPHAASEEIDSPPSVA